MVRFLLFLLGLVTTARSGPREAAWAWADGAPDGRGQAALSSSRGRHTEVLDPVTPTPPAGSGMDPRGASSGWAWPGSPTAPRPALGEVDGDPGPARPDLPQGDRCRRPDGAVGGPAPGRAQRPPAEREVRLAVAGGPRDHRHDHQYRPRPVGAAEDRGDLQARTGPGELHLRLHSQGVQEHWAVAVLVRQHLLRRGSRVRHRRPQPGALLVGTGHRALPAAGAEPPAGRQARPGGASTMVLPPPAAAAVRARRDHRQHPVATDRRAAQLDLSRASAAAWCCGRSFRSPCSTPRPSRSPSTRPVTPRRSLARWSPRAEAQATRTIRDNFVQPTVNAFGYRSTGSRFAGPLRRN